MCKRVLSYVFFSILCALCFCACGSSKEKIQIALITDGGTIEDDSYNQSAWEGIEKYALEHAKTYAYYQPKEPDTKAYLNSIKEAVKDGASIIFCTSYLQEEAVYQAQETYKKVSFVLIDGVPHDKDFSDYTIKSNTLSVQFEEEEAGFLAGYAAVRDGNTSLGFMGGIPEESVIRYGYGFVQGADYAAIEMGVNVTVNYCYTDTFFENESVKELAAKWYTEGVQVIFVSGGEIGRSVMDAAEMIGLNCKVIGADVDQNEESYTVLTSAMKMISNAAYNSLVAFDEGRFVGGQKYYYQASNQGVGLAMDHARFQKFSTLEYDTIFSHLSDGTIVPYADVSVGTTDDLEFVNTTVTYVVME